MACSSSLLVVRDAGPKRGRGIFATAAIPAQTNYYSTRADATVLYSPFAGNTCAYCYLPFGHCGGTPYVCPTCDQFVICRRCAFVLANGAELEASGNGHSSGSSVGTVDEAPPPLLAHEKLRIHRIACQWYQQLPESAREQPGKDTDYVRYCFEYGARVLLNDDAFTEAMSLLRDNEDVLPVADVRLCSGLAKNVAELLNPSSKPAPSVATTRQRQFPLSEKQLKKALLQTRYNSLGFPFNDEETLGWSLDGFLCMINHSCCPNTAVVAAEDREPNFGKIALRSLRPISCGEEITISYVDLLPGGNTPEGLQADVTARTRCLLDKYRFLCTCELCVQQRQTRRPSGNK